MVDTALRFAKAPSSVEATAPSSVPFHVAYVMSRFPKLTETFVLREMVELEKSGVKVSVYPLQRERTKTIHAAAIPFVTRACFTPWLSVAILWANIQFFLRNPRRYLSTFGTLIKANFGCWRYLSGAILFFPKIVYLAARMRRDGIRHVQAHFASHPAMAAWTIHQLVGIPYSFTAHGSDLHRDRHMLLEKVAAAAAVITISEYNRRMILEECGDQFADKVHVIHCGINPHDFPPRTVATPFERGDGPFRIICVGTLHEVKGQRYLLEACGKLRAAGLDLFCQFLGDGPDREALQQLADELGVRDHVEFCGSRTTDEVRRLMAESDVIVAPSVPTADGRREGIPVVLMEGLGTGLPAIASRLSGIPELIRDEETGLLVPPRDAAAIAEAIHRLARNPTLRRQLAEAGCELVQREFHVVTNTLLLRRLLTGESLPSDNPNESHFSRSEPTDDLVTADRELTTCPV